ncbi:hypothetical protein DJ252_24045 [Salmonella enterica subsp. enterica serovar Uzaramo]|nr:hypothetical protein [Salmonella enterica]EEE9947993.1 hypothetical protein [Salmonella enterica subsp. enterica serovar Uzaramo]EEL6611813.1 hypothetical protein [Salmonella enterica]EFO5310529.1 hypothetical protein [Salmonella enterica]EFO8059033.1 hypothetical protein [Salmonella enterica]
MPSNRRLWTRKEYDFLRDNYGKMTVDKMAQILDRTPGSVRTRLNGWGISTGFYIYPDSTVVKVVKFKIPDPD